MKRRKIVLGRLNNLYESNFFWPNSMCISKPGICAESMNWRLVVVMLCDVKGATLDYCCIPIMWILGRQNDCLLMEMSGDWCYIIYFKYSFCTKKIYDCKGIEKMP